MLERRRDSLVEDIAHSMLTGSNNRGLGGTYAQGTMPPSLATSLLRTHFLTQGGPIFDLSILKQQMEQDKLREQQAAAAAAARVPTYSLHEGYDKFVALPGSGPRQRTKAVVPRCLGRLPPLRDSLFANRLKCVADSGLASSRRFRAGWTANWTLANPGCPSRPFAEEQPGYVSLEQVLRKSRLFFILYLNLFV